MHITSNSHNVGGITVGPIRRMVVTTLPAPWFSRTVTFRGEDGQTHDFTAFGATEEALHIPDVTSLNAKAVDG